MSLETKLVAFAQAVGVDIGELIETRGDLATLTTVQKTSLVAAINELKAGLGSIGLTAIINDAAGVGVVDKTWSADKIGSALDALKTEIDGLYENIGVGNPEVDLVAAYTTAKAAP